MAIKIFDFECINGHRFEGSFASLAEMQEQLEAGLVRCPVCDAKEVKKLPTAAHISEAAAKKHRRRELQFAAEALMREVSKAAENAEDVGENLAREARRMLRGETPRRLVKGQCTEEEARELLEEGIGLLPVPESSGKTLN